MVVKVETAIRRGLPGEFVFMAALAVRAWEIPAKSEPLGDRRRAELEANFLGYLHENADGVLVAELDGKILGWGARVPGSNYIADLWIDPPYHGQGIGGRILDALMAQILLDASIQQRSARMPIISRPSAFTRKWAFASSGVAKKHRSAWAASLKKCACAQRFETPSVAEQSGAPILLLRVPVFLRRRAIMWIMLTDVSGEKLAINFNHVLSYNAYGTGTRILTMSADQTFFVKESLEDIESRLGINVKA